MNKQIHNSNARPRNKVEFRKRSSKDLVYNELKPFRSKRTSMTENNKMEEDISHEIEMINEEKYEEDKITQQNVEIETINNQISNEIMMEEINEYDLNLSNEQFEKVMNTFEIPKKCIVCELSEYGKPCNVPENVKEMETIIFPFKSNKNYGILAYVNKMKLLNKRINKCLVHLKHEKSSYPSFMKRIRKTLKEKFKLKNEPLIHSLQVKKCVRRYKYNGYFTLFLLETFMKTRNSNNSKDQQKKLNEYLTDLNMIKSFRRYKRIIN